MNTPKDETVLKIHAGGTGMVLFLSTAALFWFCFLMSIKKHIQGSGLHINTSFMKDLVIGLVLCGGWSIYVFIYWKFNFIELGNGKLTASVSDRSGVFGRSKASIWPKFVKTDIALNDIKTINFKRPEVLIFCPVFEIIDKNDKTYYIDTKPFSKADCRRFIKDLKRKGIPGAVEIGTI